MMHFPIQNNLRQLIILLGWSSLLLIGLGVKPLTASANIGFGWASPTVGYGSFGYNFPCGGNCKYPPQRIDEYVNFDYPVDQAFLANIHSSILLNDAGYIGFWGASNGSYVYQENAGDPSNCWHSPSFGNGVSGVGYQLHIQTFIVDSCGGGSGGGASFAVTRPTPYPSCGFSATQGAGLGGGSLGWWTGGANLAGVIIYGPGLNTYVGTSGSTSINPGYNATYTLQVWNIYGVYNYCYATFTYAPPSASLTANPSNPGLNVASTLAWSTTNAGSVTLSSFGAVGPWGSRTITPTQPTTNYTLTASGPGGTVSQNVTINVQPPTVNLTVNGTHGSLSLPWNGSLKLAWTATNASTCTATGSWTSTWPLSGTVSPTITNISTAPATYTYVLSCSALGRTAADYSTVTVQPPPAPTVSLLANGSHGLTIDYNHDLVLSWSTTTTTTCTASGSWSGSKGLNGREDVGNQTTNHTYVLTCIGPSGLSASDQVAITVGPKPSDFPTALFQDSFAAGQIILHRAGDLTIKKDATVQQSPPPGFTNIVPPQTHEGS